MKLPPPDPHWSNFGRAAGERAGTEWLVRFRHRRTKIAVERIVRDYAMVETMVERMGEDGYERLEVLVRTIPAWEPWHAFQ